MQAVLKPLKLTMAFRQTQLQFSTVAVQSCTVCQAATDYSPTSISGMYTSSTLQSQLSIHDSVPLLFAGSQGVDRRCDWEGMDLSCMCGQAVWV